MKGAAELSILPVKNILRRKGQSGMTAFIAAVSVFTFVVILGVLQTFQQGMQLTAARLGADIIVLPGRGNQSAYHTILTGEPQNTYMDEAVMDTLTSVDGIAQMTAQFFTQSLEESCCSLGAELRVVGYDRESDFILAPWFETQDMSLPPSNQMICGSQVPSFLGDATILLGQRFTVAGRLYETGSGMDQTMFIDMDTARNLATQNLYLKEYWQGRDVNTLISSVLIKAKPGRDLSELVDQINRLGLEVTATATDTVISATRAQILTIRNLVWMLWFVILLLSVLALWARFHALVRSRRREIGLLRAMGHTSREVFFMILGETWLLAAGGGTLGSVLGAFAAKPAISYVQRMMHLSVGAWSLSGAARWAMGGVLLSMLLGLVGAYFPCRKSAALEPIDAINRGGLD